MPNNLRSEWELIYKNYFRKQVNFSQLFIPPHYDPEKHFAVIVAERTTRSRVVKNLRKKVIIQTVHSRDLRMNTVEDERSPYQDYVVFFEKNTEANKGMFTFSASELRERNISGITFTERLLLEFWYFNATKQHLDTDSITLCSGSRFSNGSVPGIFWSRANHCLVVRQIKENEANCYCRPRVVLKF